MSESREIGSTWRFGPFSLNTVAGELRRENARVRLQPQPLRLLILLTGRPGELISREEIRRAIWGDEVHLEFEPALNFAIGQVRAALRDSASSPVYIETVPKVGYRFIAEIQKLEVGVSGAGMLPGAPGVGADSKDVLSSPAGVSAGHGETGSVPAAGELAAVVAVGGALDRVSAASRKSWAIAVAAFFGVLLLLGVVRWIRLASLPQNSTSIVVLPFVNLTGDPAKEYLADGLTEEMIARLAMSSQGHLRVIARTSSMFYKSKAVTVKRVGYEVGAAYVLESSIRSEGTGLQVTMQLVRAVDESHVWTDVLSTSRDQIFVTAGGAVSEMLKALPLAESGWRTKEIYVSPSATARDQYLRGQQFLWLRTRDSLYEALDSFQSAVSADPSYAQAYAQLATTYNLLGQYGWMKQKEAAALGEKAANSSLALDATSADAHAARGFSRWFYQWDWIAGEQDFNDALRSDPFNANALHWYALALLTEGRFKEARDVMDRALRVDPKSQILQTNRGWVEYFAGKPEEAVRRMEEVLRYDPGFLSAHNKLWSVYSFQKRDLDAFRQLRFILPYSVDPDVEQAILVAYQTGGYSAAMREWLRSPVEAGRGSAVDLARIALFADERERAVTILMDGYRAHDGWMVFALTDPVFEELRSDPRIKSIAQELRTKQHGTL
ncbi:MAG: winged helix-turn-helix domain-containing protein [Acidobacteriota bacterium]|nr:winged helix-turn-helix domain-containing protein [Acidobacteriota bacterium]